jgi:hypothetical protein
MYREILTSYHENKGKEPFKCESCGKEDMLFPKCPITGNPVGQGFEHVCEVCRGTMRRK